MVQKDCVKVKNNKPKIIIITGVTSVGKTSTSVKLARLVGGEIISADSIQVYKGFDIGSAKVTSEEMQNIPHHLIDFQNPMEEYSAGTFAEMADNKIQEIINRKNTPIIVGGTGLYISALLFPFDTIAKRNEKYRASLQQILLSENGKEKLYNMLNDIDNITAKSLNINQTDRIIRALEIYHETGIKKSELCRENKSKYDYLLIVLCRDRGEVYKAIDSRVDDMVKNGLIDEVKNLVKMGFHDAPAMKGIGYKEILAFLDGKIDKDTAINLIKQRTRNYAKRQITFFKKMPNVKLVQYNNFDEIKKLTDKFLGE